MREAYRHYREEFPYDLDVQHKITPYTEKPTFHVHSQMEIIYPLSDNLLFYSEQSVFRVPPHSLLLINSMSLHYLAYLDDGKDCDRYVATFAPEVILRINMPEINLLDCFLRHQEGAMLIPQQALNQPAIKASFDYLTYMTSLRGKKGPDEKKQLIDKIDLLSMSMELGKLLLHINRYLYSIPDQEINRNTPSYKEHSSLVSEICAYIDRHFMEPISMDLIAKEFSASRTQIYTIFREVLRISVGDYLLNVRMNNAKILLATTEYSIEIISQMTGYGSISSFSRTFKTEAGVSPKEYRKKQRVN